MIRGIFQGTLGSLLIAIVMRLAFDAYAEPPPRDGSVVIWYQIQYLPNPYLPPYAVEVHPQFKVDFRMFFKDKPTTRSVTVSPTAELVSCWQYQLAERKWMFCGWVWMEKEMISALHVDATDKTLL